MTLLKKAWLSAVATFVTVASITLLASAFNVPKKNIPSEVPKRVETWVFIGDSPAQITDASAYSQTASPGENCQTPQAALPCEILAEATNEQDLQNELQNLGASGVLNDAAISFREN